MHSTFLIGRLFGHLAHSSPFSYQTFFLILVLCHCLLPTISSLILPYSLTTGHILYRATTCWQLLQYSYQANILDLLGSFVSSTFRMPIKFLTINTKGLNHPAKRSSLWKLAKESHCDILCVQETHFKASSPPNCSNSQFPHIFTASTNSKKRGVLIAVNSSITFELHDKVLDHEGRYIILICSLNNSLFTLGNVYAPNVHQISFLRKLKRKIDTVQKGALLWCGDFNLTPDFNLDFSIPSRRRNLSLGPLLKEFQLQDIWRCQHTSERDFTFFSPCHNSYSRIDLFLSDQWTLQKISQSLDNLVRPLSSEYYLRGLFLPLTNFPLADEH